MRFFKKWAFVPTALVLIVITYLSLAEDPMHAQELHLFKGADKLVHGCMYLALVVVGCFDMYRAKLLPFRTSCVWCLVVAVVWGGLMELLQGALTMGRTADWFDFLANSCGALLGLLAGLYVVPRILDRRH